MLHGGKLRRPRRRGPGAALLAGAGDVRAAEEGEALRAVVLPLLPLQAVLFEDEQRLLAMLGDHSAASRPRYIPRRNARDHTRGNPNGSFAPGGAAWRALEASPLVQRVTEWDRACFGYPPLRTTR